MTKFNEADIGALFETSLKQAKRNLSKLKISGGKEPSFAGLSGWVFEQTIEHCIRSELRSKGINTLIKEQHSLGGRVKADLLIGNIAIEIKTSGIFGLSDVCRYQRYKKAAHINGYDYIFLSRGESYRPYRDGITKALGGSNVFYLDKRGAWGRFMTFLIRRAGKQK